MNRSGKAETLFFTGCRAGFGKLAPALGLKIKKSAADIAVIGESAVLIPEIKAEVAFVPDGGDCVSGAINCVSAVSAGMGSKATLCFSSIGDETATLSVNREVDFFGEIIEPGEITVGFDKSLSIYENMVYGFLKHFL